MRIVIREEGRQTDHQLGSGTRSVQAQADDGGDALAGSRISSISGTAARFGALISRNKVKGFFTL